MTAGRVASEATPDIAWDHRIDAYPVALGWQPGGQRLVVATSEGPIRWLDAATGLACAEAAGHAEGTLTAVWSPDGQWLVSGGQDGCVRWWSADGRAVAQSERGRPWVEQVAWHPTGATVATAAGPLVTLWRAPGIIDRTYGPHPSTVSGLDWRGDGAQLAVSHFGGVTCWKPPRAHPERRFEWKGSLLNVRWRPGGKHIVGACQDHTVHIWDARSGENLEMAGYQVKPKALSFSADGRWLATTGGPSASVWDFSGAGPAGRTPFLLGQHGNLLQGALFAPKGAWCATGDRNGVVRLWTVSERGAVAHHAMGHPAAVATMAWDPTGRRLAVAYENGTIVCTLLGEPPAT